MCVLEDTPYDSEDLLQAALVQYPQVIAGPTTNGRENRLLLIAREQGVPASEDGGNVFNLDHLFVDTEGVPVLVEVKRSTDTRIRREVVGQMLDYAANGIRYWPMDDLQAALEARAADQETSIEELIRTELESDHSVDELMGLFQSNLRAGNVRLVFVADSLPDRLCRIIEFLNEQMTPAEVLGVEVRQYTGAGHTVYVPRVVGRTATARASKSNSGKVWDRDSLLDRVVGVAPAAEVELMKRLLDHAERHGSRLSWGRGTSPGVSGWYEVNGVSTQVWVLRTNSEASGADAYLMFYLADLAKKAPAERIEAMAQLLSQIPNLAPKIDEARDNGWNKWPAVHLRDVVGIPEREEVVFRAVDLLVAEPGQTGPA